MPNVRSNDPAPWVDLPHAVERLWAAQHLAGEQQALLAQFMTPAPVARLVASMPSRRRDHIRLLDPGAGLGSLTAAFVARAASQKQPPKSISVAAVEIDSKLARALKQTLDLCADVSLGAGIGFSYEIIHDEFVSSALRLVPRAALHGREFDCVLMNPPYGKLNIDTATYRLLLNSGVRVTNWYAAFVMTALGLLTDGGELVAITPRSFCNGTYFRPFRRALLAATSLRRLHVFESRSAAFRRDKVLQENVIFHVERTTRRPVWVTLSTSATPADRPHVRRVAYERVVAPNDAELFIRIPGDDRSAATQNLTAPSTALTELGFQVSTGPIVDFRAREFLRREPDQSTVPLIYPAHLEHGVVLWPKLSSRKHNALLRCEATSKMLVPNERYVLVRRFSAKEERRRVVAAVYEPLPQTACVGFENHLNYFHAHGHGIERDVAWGLALYLNSTVVDRCVREFSGHTQVNATDLRNLPYPPLETLARIGRGLTSMPSQEEIDARLHEAPVAA